MKPIRDIRRAGRRGASLRREGLLLRSFGPITIALLMGCSPSEAAEEGVVHPRPEFSLRTGPAAFVIPATPTSGGSPADDDVLLGAAGSAEPLFSIGALDAPEEQVFGRVQDAVVDDDGRLAVLDAHNNQLRIFGSQGRLVSVLGGGGMGPGEFRAPRAVALGPDGEFVVFDGLGTVSWFEVEADSARLIRSFEVRGDIFDGCVMGDRVFVHGKLPGREGSVHTYTSDGQHVASFAEVYRSGHAIVDYQISRGRIACLAEEDLVLMAFEILPEVRAYTPGGELAWWAEVQGFRAVRVTQLARGSRLGGEGTHDLMTALAPVGEGGEVMLQISHTSDSGQEPLSARSLLINVADRSVRQVRSVPGRLLDVDERFLLVLRDDPYAQLDLYDRTEEDG